MRFTSLGIVIILALAGCVTDTDTRYSSTADSGYTGPHGIGVLVDDPNAEAEMEEDPNNWPLCSDGARHPDCRDAPEGY